MNCLPLLCPWRYPGPPHQAHGHWSVRRSSHRASFALRPPVRLCAYMKTTLVPWGTAGCRESASSGKHRLGKGTHCSAGLQDSETRLFSSSCTPEGVICRDTECAGLGSILSLTSAPPYCPNVLQAISSMSVSHHHHPPHTHTMLPSVPQGSQPNLWVFTTPHLLL